MAALIAGAPAAQAQANEGAALQAFTTTKFYNRLITRAFSSLPPEVFHRCPALVSRGSQVTVVLPVTFAPDGVPNGGVWKQQFPVSGCGNDTTLNFYFQAAPERKISTVLAAPGDTHASLILQRDARRYAGAAVIATRKGCTALILTTTQFQGYGLVSPPARDPGNGHQLRPWRETWTMVGCGHTYNVPLDFMPVASGTQVIQPGGISEH